MSKPEQPDWLKQYAGGYANSVKIAVYLEGKKYAIIRFPGGSYWSGIAGMRYSQSHYDLVDKTQDSFWTDHEKRELWSGRLTKEAKSKLLEELNAAELKATDLEDQAKDMKQAEQDWKKENGKADKTSPKVD